MSSSRFSFLGCALLVAVVFDVANLKIVNSHMDGGCPGQNPRLICVMKMPATSKMVSVVVTIRATAIVF